MDAMEKIVSLCKRRGFIFPSSEIYGGLNGFWDYGPLGVELKRNIKEAWWDDMVAHHDETATPAGAPSAFGMVGLDSSILMNPKVWEASGHVGGFSDPMVDDRETRARYRADQLAVFALELVGGDGNVERYDEILFAVAGRGRQDRAEPSSSSRIANASPRCRRARAARRRAPWRCPDALQDEALRAKVLAPGASAPGHADRAARVQPDVQDARRRARGQLERRVPAARDGAGHLRQLQERLRHRRACACRSASARSARASATRSTRATSRSAPASSSRWRSSSSATRTRRRSGIEYWRERRYRWYVDLGLKQANSALARARPGRARALRRGHRRHRVRLPVRPQRAGGHRPPHGLRPAPAHADERQGSALLRRSGARTKKRAAICRTSSSRRPAPIAARSRSSARRTARTRSAASRAPC